MTADLTQVAACYAYAVIRKWIAGNRIRIIYPRAGLPIAALGDAGARDVIASAGVAVLSRYVHYAYAGKQEYFYSHCGDDPANIRH